MIIEHLTFEVPPEHQATFLHWDDRLWTRLLAQQPGYQGKEIWRDPQIPQRLHLMIRWETWEHWQTLAPDLLAATEQQFQAALHAAHCSYHFLGCQGLETVASPPTPEARSLLQ